MNDAGGETNLVKKTMRFGRAATIAGILMFVLAVAQACITFSKAMDSAKRATTSETATPPVAKVLLDTLLYSSFASPFIVFGAGVLAMAAARAASQEGAPGWASQQDETFTVIATRFAKITEVVGWIYLFVNAAVFIYAAYGRIAGMIAAKDGAAGGLSRAILAAGYFGTSMVVGVLRVFFVFILGALMIRTLLVIARRSAALRGASDAAAREVGNVG